MRVTVSERWNGGVKLDNRAASMNTDRGTVGQLKIVADGTKRYATFTHFRDGREAMILPPLWRAEVLSLDESTITLCGLQRTAEGAPLHFQEWRCDIVDKQKQW